MINDEELSIKLDSVLKNQEEIKALNVLILKALDRLVQQERGPEDFIRNVLANITSNKIEWNKEVNSVNRIVC